jgi:hypothetical protein
VADRGCYRFAQRIERARADVAIDDADAADREQPEAGPAFAGRAIGVGQRTVRKGRSYLTHDRWGSPIDGMLRCNNSGTAVI